MFVLSEEQCRAVVRISADPSFKAVLAWLVECNEQSRTNMVNELGDAQLRQQQGACRALRSVIECLANAEAQLQQKTRRIR